MFKANVDEDDGISDVMKLTYLNKALTGSAKEAVDGLVYNDDAYKETVDILHGSLQSLVRGAGRITLQSTEELAQVDGPNSKIFRSTNNKIDSIFRQLKDQGEQTDGNKSLIMDVLGKYPGSVLKELSTRNGVGIKSTIKEVRDSLNEFIIQQRSLSELMNDLEPFVSSQSIAGELTLDPTHSSNESSLHSDDEITESSPTSASAFLSFGHQVQRQEPLNPGKPTPTCRFCRQLHFSDLCPVYTDVQSRKQRSSNCCFLCLGKGHVAAGCNKNRRCYYCKDASHHSSFCKKQFSDLPPASQASENLSTTDSHVGPNIIGHSSSTSESPSATVTSTNGSASLNGPNIIGRLATATTTSGNSLGKKGIMQTAVTNIHGLTSVASARILLDGGADTTWISNTLAERIGARSVGKELVSVATFQDNNRKTEWYDSFEFDIQTTQGGKMTVKALGTDFISPPIEKRVVNLKRHPLLRSISLAEPLATHNQFVNVDLLLGSDYYFDVVHAERIELSWGLRLLGTAFGYVLAGSLDSDCPTTIQLLSSTVRFDASIMGSELGGYQRSLQRRCVSSPVNECMPSNTGVIDTGFPPLRNRRPSELRLGACSRTF